LLKPTAYLSHRLLAYQPPAAKAVAVFDAMRAI
jgi:hypothetical protein